jgi:hypothetical protein
MLIHQRFFYYWLLFVMSFLLLQCGSYQAQPYDFPRPVDTRSKPITYQEKQIYRLESAGVYVDNQFDGARVNNCQLNGDTIQVTIEAENEPINPSPYYGFKIWSDTEKEVLLELNYPNGRHRYWPKLSNDRQNWQRMDSADFQLAVDSVNAYLKLSLSTDTLWVAAQELHTSTDVRAWCMEKAAHPDVSFSVVGKSRLDRDLLHLEIGRGASRQKEAVLIISRQHPPEVTGYLAMQAFVDAILEDTPVANAFRSRFRILVFPLMNPDGVDMGHWRHNVGGVDLNRDWAYYHQPEVRQVANYFVKTLRKNKNKAILGLDFHSTYEDVFYTMTDETPAHIKGFKDYWLQGIDQSFPGYVPRDAPSAALTPTSKNWFATQLTADAVTYEIGDDTPRDFIREKGRVSAYEMMKLLILRK